MHYFIIFCNIVKTGIAYAESFFCRTPTLGFKKIGLWLWGRIRTLATLTPHP